MPQYLVAGYMPDDFDPSSVTATAANLRTFARKTGAEQWTDGGLGQERIWPANPLKIMGNKQNVTRASECVQVPFGVDSLG